MGPRKSQGSLEEGERKVRLREGAEAEAEVGVVWGNGPKNSVDSRTWKKQGNGSLLEPLEGIEPGQPMVDS